MSNIFFFIVLPYLTLFVFLLGTAYIYHYKGFQVSSLSSQFLESKQLFFGSRPFHIGIAFLFFGHLVAFLFPRSVLIWDQKPMRLFILEITAFAFGLITLTGLVILIIRRLQNKQLKVVTSRMDIFVYSILMLAVISGIYTAFFHRWGSSWFAQILTPYLWSILTFKADISAVSALPFMVKLHIVSAFILVGSVPFTRFIHFLVYPLNYLWRKPQLFIWNLKKD